MFEKEAEIEELQHLSMEKAKEHILIPHTKKEELIYANGYFLGRKEGAEFAYNKANEWHDLKKNPNDLPKENDVYLVIVGSDGTKYRSLERYYPDTKEWSTVCNILFWKEIVLPKLKEGE